jgi:hypothetical protein
MRFMVMVRTTQELEAGVPESAEAMQAMRDYNIALADAGVRVAVGGLRPSSRGARVRFSRSRGKVSVTDGPFLEVKELIAGYWIWELPSLDDAIAWASRAPLGEGGQLEIRQLATDEDFGDAMTEALQEQQERMRSQLSAQQGAA